MKKILFVLTLIFVTLFAGCGQENNSEVKQTEKQQAEVAEKKVAEFPFGFEEFSLGGIALNMPLTEAEKICGEPIEKINHSTQIVNGVFKYNKGIEIFVWGKPQKVFSVATDIDNGLSTPAGVHVRVIKA